MKRAIHGLVAVCLLTWSHAGWAEQDPFAGGFDALAVAEVDGSASLRAKKKLRRMEPDMVQVEVRAVDDKPFPHCTFTGIVKKSARAKKDYFQLLGRGKVYRFQPILKEKNGQIDLADDLTQNNLGACYFPRRTQLVVKVSGVNLQKKVFNAAEIYVK